MRSLNVVLALLFAFVATSYAWPSAVHAALEARKPGGNGTNSERNNPTKKACSQIRRLTKITELVANQTKLDELVAQGKMNTAMVDALKAKAADASTKLQTLESNSTLTGECAAINAENKMKQECRQMKELKKLTALMGNQTALDAMAAKKKLNDTEKAELSKKVQDAGTKLQALSTNTTLTTFCANQKQQKGTSNPDNAEGSGASGNAASSQQASKSGAMGMELRIPSYVFISTLAGATVLLL